ncbi:MAG TPA: hypothetical protein VNK49_02000 [Anaerolineales bacterium]|nr:hypothetical protein [Anaerolineales bacterium]
MLFLLSFPLAYFYLRLVFLYYAYYYIGVNNYANAGWLTYVVTPLMFFCFNATGFAAQWIARRRGMDKLKSTSVGVLAMIGLFTAAFLYTVLSHLDYPSPKDYNLFEFFGYLLGRK